MLLFQLLADGGATDAAGLLSQVAREYGIFAAMVVFFIGWSFIREKQLNGRLDATNKFIMETLITTLEHNTQAFERLDGRITALQKP